MKKWWIAAVCASTLVLGACNAETAKEEKKEEPKKEQVEETEKENEKEENDEGSVVDEEEEIEDETADHTGETEEVDTVDEEEEIEEVPAAPTVPTITRDQAGALLAHITEVLVESYNTSHRVFDEGISYGQVVVDVDPGFFTESYKSHLIERGQEINPDSGETVYLFLYTGDPVSETGDSDVPTHYEIVSQENGRLVVEVYQYEMIDIGEFALSSNPLYVEFLYEDGRWKLNNEYYERS